MTRRPASRVPARSAAVRASALAAALLFRAPDAAFCEGDAPGPGPVLASRSAILLDATTGTVLYEKDADAVIPPASLTKLMTMHVVQKAVDSGSASFDDVVDLPRETWGSSQPRGSSLMFLAPGQRVTLRELMLGLAVSSGNDAAVAAAVHVAGSVGAFASLMNAEASAMGLVSTSFVEPSGISERNLTTAREFAAFCLRYLSEHPRAIAEFHSVREFAYPKPENLPEAFRDDPRTIVQRNRNLLLDSCEGVDGLKTGYIVESGYNIALTAERNGTRLAAVLLGGPGSSSASGGRIRAEDGGSLLDWGFANFRTVRPVVRSLEAARVWKGKADKVALEFAGSLAFTSRLSRDLPVRWTLSLDKDIQAPLDRGARLGFLSFEDDLGELHRVDVIAAESVARAGWFKRAAHSVALFFRRLFGAAS